jgi:hypothetical protein
MDSSATEMRIGLIAVAFSSVVDRLGPAAEVNAARANDKVSHSAADKRAHDTNDELQLSSAAEEAADSEAEAETDPSTQQASQAGQFSKEEQQQVQELKKRDT